MRNDAVLADVLLRFLRDKDEDGHYAGYWFIGANQLTLDSEQPITPEERAVLIAALPQEDA